jgi:hypothetical protein
MLEADGKFYMVYRYSYDGQNRYTDAIYPASEYIFAMDYLRKLAAEDAAYKWNTDEELKKINPGQYCYEVVYFEELTMNEEL